LLSEIKKLTSVEQTEVNITAFWSLEPVRHWWWSEIHHLPQQHFRCTNNNHNDHKNEETKEQPPTMAIVMIKVM